MSTTKNSPPPEVQRYLELNEQKRELKQQLKETQEELDQLEHHLIEGLFTSLGARSLKFDDATLSVREDIRASGGGDRDAAVEALQKEGWGFLVKPNFHSGQLAAFVREKIQEVEDQHGDEAMGWTFDELVERAIGKELAQHISVTKQQSLSVSRR